MNIREAILKAADFLERQPERFDFFKTLSPESEFQRGCYVGWIAYFAGRGGRQQCGTGEDDAPLCRELLGISFAEFQDRMIPICVHELGATIGFPGSAADALRLYAARYLQPTVGAKSEGHTTPPTTTTPNYNWEGLAQRLAKEPKALTHVRDAA